MELMTVPKLVKKWRALDPRTIVNEAMLTQLMREGKIPYSMRGNRMIADFSTVVHTITDRLFLYDFHGIPKLRTVTQAAKELREANPDIGINEKHIRAFLRSDTLRSIEIGNRHYIALQSFDAPYNRALFGCIRETKPDRRLGRRDAEVQIEEIRANGTKGVTVKRVK